MSQENVKLHYRALDAVNRHDIEALIALMDDEVEAVSALVAIEGGYHGHDGMRIWWENLLEAFPDFATEVVEVQDHGDVTVAEIRNRGHGADSNAPFVQTLWHAVRWRHGSCAWWATLRTHAEALEAAGLSQQDAHADRPGMGAAGFEPATSRV
jgi:ketosteroid isomerase-like protein